MLTLLTILSIIAFVAFVAYGYDKRASLRGAERVSERTLHLLALCGGWPGALAGQLLFRHKTRKASFQACFWLTVLLNGAMLIAWRGASCSTFSRGKFPCFHALRSIDQPPLPGKHSST